MTIGPPETMREHVVAAANAMKRGDWMQAKDYLLNIKVTKIIWYKIKQKFLSAIQFQEWDFILYSCRPGTCSLMLTK